MVVISWHQLEINSTSREIGFESFNFQIAWKKYSQYGSFEYDYNTPGSEFYLTLSKDCDELKAKAGDVVGWQAKFWVNQNDLNSTSLHAKHRGELIDGFKKSLEAKPKLATWIICTPGQPSNTRPHKVKDKLLEELCTIKNISVLFWNKPTYESFFHQDPDGLSHIFSHYFGQKFIGFDFLKDYSLQRIRALKDKFDVELYTSGEIDKQIYPILNIKNSINELKIDLHKLKDEVEEITKSEYWNTDSTDFQAIQYGQNLKTLLDALICVSQKTLNVEATVDLRLIPQSILSIRSAEASRIRSLIDQTNKSAKEYENERKGSSFNANEMEIRRYLDYLYSSVDNILTNWSTISTLSEVALHKYVHIFGKAGYGKTYLACSICNEFLSKNLSAFLFLASDIRVGSDVKKQIRDTLSIDHSMSFLDFLGALDNLGFVNNQRIPIVIDGLNETMPTADIWSHELSYLIDDINKFQNLVLITTCRDSYVEQVFNGKKHHTEVSGSIHIDGFDDSNIDVVIDKYCKKYQITILNGNYEKRLLKDPLMLKMFAVANEGKSITVNEANLYNTINEYLTALIDKVATQAGVVNPVLKQQIRGRINSFSSELWERDSRGLNYPDDFVQIFDPDYSPSITNWDDTNSARILDEGIFIKRTIAGQNEYAEFTYDRLAGFCIAKAILFENRNSVEILERVQSKELISKLANEQQPEKNHPLREDIIQSIIFLFPRYTGKELYTVVPDNNIITQNNISMINVFASTATGQESFSNFVESIEIKNQNMPYLMETIISSVIDGKAYWLVDILSAKLQKMAMNQIDIIWSEATRKKSSEILDYLNALINQYETNQPLGSEIAVKQMTFVALLMSSTNRLLRDTATKALVTMGVHYPREMFETFKDLESIDDLSIFDRLTAALCGVVLQTDENELSKEIAYYLEKSCLEQIKTTHLLILDYIDTILNLAEYRCGYARNQEWRSKLGLLPWPEDEECKAEVTGDGRATWGYGPVHDDFAKYILGSITRRENWSNDCKAPTLKECLAMVIWRIKKLGYSESLFGKIDEEIAKGSDYRRFHNTVSTERYGKKYSWIAFFELLGQFILNGLYKSGYGPLFRTSRVDIDPTFPKLPNKKQLVNDCFLPDFKGDLQKWIVNDKGSYLNGIYINRFRDSVYEWVLLYGSMNQEASNKARIDIYTDALLTSTHNIDKLTEYLNKNRFIHEAHSFYYIFAGEIAWSNNIVYEERTMTNENDKQKIEVIFPYSMFSWESYHSETNNVGSVPFVCRRIFTDLDLMFNVMDQSCRTTEGELAVRLVQDDYSKYLYIRKDLLLGYMKKYELSLIWYEYDIRYGGSKQGDQKLDPSYTDFKSTKVMR